jgi:tRNA/tmRNA/rRNA uracil-C5-methylase (TrmA/RlmC/RlmD family)
MRIWHVTVRHSEVSGQTLVILHSRSQGAAVPRHHRGQGRAHVPRRPDVGPSLEPDSQSSYDIPLSRREVKRAVASLSQSLTASDPLALTVVEVMEDGTINLLGATPEAAALAADAAADAMTGTLLQDVTSRSLETSAPLGAWLEQLGGRNYWVAPEAFFQANTGAANAMLSEVLAHVPARLGLVIDAHAGVGTFGFAVAPRAQEVLLFESSNASVASGQWTALTSRIANVNYLHGRAEQLIKRLPANRRPDLVILDPPRTGCHPDLLAEIISRAVSRIIYVSCDPSTLARDLKILSPHYRLASTRAVDMFPQTFHIESVSVLERVASTD